jgi:hypothetical protein
MTANQVAQTNAAMTPQMDVEDVAQWFRRNTDDTDGWREWRPVDFADYPE